MKIDVLAFGAHPDDIELSCAGTLLVEKMRGKTIGVVDLTEGELGTRGNKHTRMEEAAAAEKIMDLDVRINLRLEDGFFQNDKASQLKIIEVIRKYQPDIILCNAINDRHPDHGRAAALVADAAFLSGLLKIETFELGIQQSAWRPNYVYHYIQDRYLEPDFLVDISEVFETKMAAIRAYKTQFFNASIEAPQTYISTPEFLNLVTYNNQLLGKRIGVKYAEGFQSKKTLGIKNLDAFIQHNT